MDSIKFMILSVWNLLNVQIAFSDSISVSYFNIIVFATLAGFFFKLIFGGGGKDE